MNSLQTTTIDNVSCVKSHYGVYLRTKWTDATFHFCCLGRYGNAFSDYLDGLDAEFSFIDIGANQGLYSLIAARNPHCTGVIAFEPVASSFEYLLDNLRINQAHAKVQAINAAVSDTAGMAEIAIKPGHSGAASLRSTKPVWLSSAETIKTVNVEQLNSVFAGAINCVIKIDVEGHELTVIQELMHSGVLARSDAIYYEVNEDWVEVEHIQKLLKSCGFSHFQPIGAGAHYDILATK
ncbi:FkbM family methyltransferase [Pseudohongiella acticola]|jgi:FkbM family methyltransferase|uniref:FkbM family methyltransferase n=1 Tax=Pseudohongiella acticola TaxID=1524254 RepID=UPI0030ED68D3